MLYRLCLSLLLLLTASAEARYGKDLPTPFGREYYFASAGKPRQLPPLLSAPEAEAWRRRITEQEWQGGPYGADLPETLLDAANYFQGRGDYEQAITLRRRAVHLTRVNDGLYSPLQLPLLRSLLEMYLDQGDLEKADEIHAYQFHLSRQHSAPGDPAWVDASIEYSDWQRKRWLLEPDPESPDRLYDIWRLLNEQDIQDEENPIPIEQLTPLVYGQLRMLYLIGVSDLGFDRETEMMMGRAYGSQQKEPSVEKSQLQFLQQGAYSRGRSRLEYLAERLADSDDYLARAEVARQLGDWNSWHGQSTRASEQYRLAWDLLQADASGELRREWFGEPLELPADGVLWPGPRPQQGVEDTVLVTAVFEVSAKGKVRQVESRTADEEREGVGYRVARWLRASQFRPRMENGELVESTGVTREYRVQ
jgi:hypothetical protein